MSTATLQRRPLGQILISEGILSEDQLRIALLEQMKQNQPIGKLLVSLGFVTEATLRQALSENLGKQSIDLSHAVVDPQAVKLVPRDLAKRHHLLPLDFDRQRRRLTLAIADINDIVGLDRVRSELEEGIEIETLLAGESEIDHAIDQYYGHELSIDGILHEIETGEIDWRSLSSSDDEYSQPVVRLIDSILTDAVKRSLGHPLRTGSQLSAHPLPYRWHASPDPCPAQILLASHDGTHQGAFRHEYRRNPCPTGWPDQPDRIGSSDRLPRRQSADHPR
jgi:general secretion pathway protein E/type IV pilus assembly protein PilB